MSMFYLLNNAHKLFGKIPQRNSRTKTALYCVHYTSYYDVSTDIHRENDSVVSWTYKISKLVSKNQHEQAIKLFKTMLLTDQRPNFVTLVSVIRSLGAFNCQDLIRVAHGFVIKSGFDLEAPVLTVLLGFYSLFDIEIARKLFDQKLHYDVVLWSAMVSAYVKNEKYEEGIECFRRMVNYGVEANYVTVVSVLPVCGRLGRLCFAKEIHGFCIKKMLYSLTIVQNSIMDVYAKCGEFESSVSVFDEIWEKDLVSWRTMICICIENGCPRKALDVFLKMQSSTIGPDESVIRDIVLAALQAEELKFGLGFHTYIEKNGFLAFVSIGTVLLQMYGKFSEFVSAWMVFSELKFKDIIAWSATIAVYARGGKPYEAINAFGQMQSLNEKPNEITFVSLLQACSAVGAKELGESIHGFITKAGYSSNTYLKSTLIDLYCKLGSIERGKAVFDEIPTKDLISWSSMINGYGLNGCGFEALETFTNMLNCGIKPNGTIFISILSACSQGGLQHEGYKMFYSMQEQFGITPKLPHYACMVDLLSRHGNIEEALMFVKKMPVVPDKRIWGALLAGCRSKCDGSIEVAEFAVQQLSTLDPENTSYYVTLLLDLHAKQGRWKDMDRLTKLVDDEGILFPSLFYAYTPLLNILHAGFACSEMKRGILEVLLVHAEGVEHTNLVGTPAYYVIIQCGNRVHKSKVSSGKDEQAWWNEKFRFEFPIADWKHMTHLKFRIMDKEFFTDGGFVGETIIFLGGIIDEGANNGSVELKPASYNVVQEDDTYKGEIKIGLKFITNKEGHMQRRAFEAPVHEPRQSLLRSITNFLKSSWLEFWNYCSRLICKNKVKKN
ncbi:putative pentatricopeptide repeat-containing protein At3g01580 [Mercurialis annua]|uniref:putative pentatricopeptide repeat-containing protein At3g01580 n=1 Tax=Mercurialis annua TaxID=3986 RepID=UPI002160148F|nr:putative pentatricopeptide repeat-containing protein At3g01580 [Mercurialis annua]